MTDINYLRTMTMHEITEIKVSDKDIKRIIVTRVPGGWIYTYIGIDGPDGSNMSTCFVSNNDKI